MIKKQQLDRLYQQYNKRCFVHPDPLEFLYAYPDKADREIAGLIASSLAYGKVTQILNSVSTVLSVMGNSPYNYLTRTDIDDLNSSFKGFRHRFADQGHLTALLTGIKNIIDCFGSLNTCFINGFASGNKDFFSAMVFFADQLTIAGDPGHLIANPRKGSACKRLHLFLRWMIRNDDVDPGGWTGIDPSMLIVPLDTHMYKIGTGLGFTSRKQANMKTALEITEGFKQLCPDDPVRYDFALTRFGIRDDLCIKTLIANTQHF